MSVATQKKSTTPTSSGAGMKFVAGASNYIDERTSISGAVKFLGRKIFPDHWSFMLGEIALYSFVVILLSGTFLTFFYDPSMVEVHYDGSYVPLKGIHMSAAYSSTLNITFDMAAFSCARSTTGPHCCSLRQLDSTCSVFSSREHSASRAKSTG